jgi:hypothetical protein
LPRDGIFTGAQESIPRIQIHQPVACADILNPLRSTEMDSKESIPPAYAAWRAGTTTLFLLGFQPPYCSKIPALVGWYDNPIPALFLAPKDCSKIPALRCIFFN